MRDVLGNIDYIFG